MHESRNVIRCMWVALSGLMLTALASAAEVKVEARQVDAKVALHMSTDVAASRELVWDVLTDYEGAPGWVPGMKQSRVISRVGSVLTVSQKGNADFVVFSMPVEAVLKVEEMPPDRVTVTSLQGSFRYMRGAYRLRVLPPADDGSPMTRVEWTGQLEPDFDLPVFMTVSVVSRNVKLQFEGLVWEMERRVAVSKGLPPPKKPGASVSPRGGEF